MNLWKKVSLLFVVLAFLPGFGSGERLFAPGQDLWDRWTAHDAQSTARIDHSVWTGLLRRFVKPGASGVNLVDYRGISGARSDLDSYISGLEATRISDFNRDEQMAFWINLYNAVTIRVVVDHFPVASIRDIDISPGVLSVGPWGKELVTVEGQKLTLNDIEHRVLRPIWKDPRIHYAVNCASIGCPNLKTKAWTADGLDAALDSAAREYVNNSRGVSIAGGDVTVSRIYDWFIEDFGGDEGGVIAHITRYASPDLARQIRGIGRLDDTEYDWTLNDAR